MDPDCDNAYSRGVSSGSTSQPVQSNFVAFEPDEKKPVLDGEDISDVYDDIDEDGSAPMQGPIFMPGADGGDGSQNLDTPQPTPQVPLAELTDISPMRLAPVFTTNMTAPSVRKKSAPLTPQDTPNPSHAQLPSILGPRPATISPAPKAPLTIITTPTPHIPQTHTLQPTPDSSQAQRPSASNTRSGSTPHTAMAPPPVVSTPAPLIQTTRPAVKTPMPVANSASSIDTQLPFSRSPLAFSIPSGSYSSLLSPSVSPGPSDIRPHIGFNLPLTSPSPSALSVVSSQNTPKLDSLAAFQKAQALFKRNRESQKARDDQAASGSSKSATQSAASSQVSKKRSLDTTGLDEDREFMSNLKQGENEDHSWMDEVDDEEDPEMTLLTDQFQTLNDKNKRGVITGTEKMQLLKVETRLLQMNRVRGGDVNQGPSNGEDEDPDSLFVPEDHDERDVVIARHRDQRVTAPPIEEGERPIIDDPEEAIFSNMLDAAIHGEPEPDRGLNKNGAPRKRRGPAPKDARERFAMDQEKAAEKAREKERKKEQKKKAATPASKSRSKSKGKGKESAKPSKSKKGKGKEKVVKDGPSLLRGIQNWKAGQDEIADSWLRTMAVNDPISDRLNNPVFQRGAEPELHGRFEKNTQFAKLISNVPEGASMREAKSDKQKLLKASRAFGTGKIKAVDGKWLLKGMASTTTLYHHQLLGAQWMVERELSAVAPHGGILADSMGLGKTIQSLALMIGNPPMDSDVTRGVKATLIVAPASVVNQWAEEIAFHTEPGTFPLVIKYKASSNLPEAVLKTMDIVITSYHEIMKQFPYPDAEAKKEIEIIGQAAWWSKVSARLGSLHKIAWYRIILDEAHAIKNNSSRTSLACQNLKSVYRWCLTGTPLMNRLEELFPYLRFLKANFTVDFKAFQRYFCDGNSADAQARIQTLLSFAMCRRTMNTTILGRAIIVLPEPKTEVLRIHFSAGEKIVYRLVENRFRATLNRFFAQGDAAKNYSIFMVQLLRLRQCTSHPFMLEQTIRESWTLEDVEELKLRLSRVDKSESLEPFYKQVECWVGEKLQNGEEDPATLPFGRGSYGRSFDFAHVLETLDETEMAERTVCGICNDLPVEGKKTTCQHIFCKECIDTSMHKDLATAETFTCPTCNRLYDPDKLVDLQQGTRSGDSEDVRSTANGDRRSKRRKIAANSKGLDMLEHEPWTDSTWVPKSDDDPNFPFTPSSKTAALKAILLKGFEEAPLDKVVVYVQFRTLARIVARICRSEGWQFLYLTGDTTQDHRTKAIAKFRSDPDAKILIAGLKCGGLGMNFQWANRCISLDLWWNHAVEQQAFGRIFRLGQKKTTHFTRIAVLNTVDVRMLMMQLHKLEVCDKSIKEGGNSSALSLRQLANLFGFLRTDEDDNILSIEADYDDAAEWEAAGRRPGMGGGGVGGD